MNEEEYLSLETLCILLDTEEKTLGKFIRKNLKIPPEKFRGKLYTLKKSKNIIKEWFVRKKHLEFIILPSKINEE